MNKEISEKIIKFLNEDAQKLGVISTVTAENKPESAFMYYAFDEDLNIYFATRVASRKYKNFMENKHIAFAVAKENPPQTLQLEGLASVVVEAEVQKSLFPELITMAAQRNFAAPISQMESSELKFLKITPNWIRFGNFEVRKHGGIFEEIKIEQ
jgi:general stress protein 26